MENSAAILKEVTGKVKKETMHVGLEQEEGIAIQTHHIFRENETCRGMGIPFM